MLDSEETFSMIGDPQFDMDDYVAENLRSTLEHFFEHYNIPAYKGGITNIRKGFVNEFDLAIYKEVASPFPEIMIHIECEQMSNIMTVRAPFPPKIVHELAQIIASCFLRVDLIKAPKSKFADPKFTIDGTYDWIVDKWNKQLKCLIEEIRDFIQFPEKASKDRWRMFLPGTMPKNQLLPFLEPYHVKQIHMVLSKYEATNPRRHKRLMRDILYPYSQTIRDLMDYGAPDFLPAEFKVKSASLCMKIRQLGADFSNPEARYCVIDRFFMSRGGDTRASWDKQYTRCYDAMVSYLDELAQLVRKHDEELLKCKGTPTTSAKGVCEFSGDEVHSKIDITPGKSIKVKKTLYSFTAAGEWKTINKFLRSIKSGDDHYTPHYPVPLTTKEVSALKGDAKALFKDYIERQPSATKERHKLFEPYARFKLELLK